MLNTPNNRPPRRRSDWTPLLEVGLSLLAFCGCSDSVPTTPNETTSPIQSTAPNDVAADVAVRQVLDGLQKQNARAVWDFLPPAHQNEIQQLVRDFASRADEATWNRLIRIVRRTSQALKKMPAPPTDSNAENNATDSAVIVRNPALLAKLLEIAAASDLGDRTRLQAADVGHICETTGSDLLRLFEESSSDSGSANESDSFAKLSQVEVRLVTASGNTATVTVRWPGQEPIEHLFVRVDGHWLPKSLAESWPIEFAAVRQRGLDWADSTTRQREVWNTQLQTAERLLDDVEAAPSAATAHQRLLAGATQIVVAWLGQSSNLPSESDHLSPSESATKPLRKSKVPDTEQLLPDK